MKRIFLILSIIFILFIPNNNFCVTHAQTDMKVSNKLSYMYDYGCTTPVNKETKVYIDESMVDFIKSTNREIVEETQTTFFIPHKKYYYIANEYVSKVVSIRKISNDVDSLIFMLRRLESEAIKYDSIHYKDIVLGYIRSINKEYDGNYYFGKWDVIAETTPYDFIQKIDNDYSHGLRFCDYFGSFIKYEKYNLSNHLEMQAKFRRQNIELNLVDNYGNNIDLIHMFASIDAIYDETGNSLSCGKNNSQRDIASWNGDLQQACKYIKTNNLNNIDFNNDILKNKVSGCSKEDIFADMDAMNITKIYLNSTENTISNSLSAYYSLIDEYNNYRYEMFINSVIIDEEDYVDTYSKIERFKHEIYYEFNLKEDGNLVIDSENYSPIEQVHNIMKDVSISINNDEMPSFEIRYFVTKGLINFIINNISNEFC
jgi:hypothetical protein